MTESALIIGVGGGLSASIARLFHKNSMQIALAARNTDKLTDLAKETSAKMYRCDASQEDDVSNLFNALDNDLGSPTIVVYNPSARVRGPITDIDPTAVQQALMVTCYGAFLVGQQAAKRMLKRGSGTILLTGATAGVKGFANSSSFAMGKFGLRGLAQSMARELAPKNIHVVHFVIDGGISPDSVNNERLHPDDIAQSYLFAHQQPRSAWSWEFELRPWVEKF